MGFRITVEDEVAGIDTTTHAESAYDFVGGGVGGGSGVDHRSGRGDRLRRATPATAGKG